MESSGVDRSSWTGVGGLHDLLSTDLIELNHRKNLARWQQLVYDCRNSGMTVRAWCAQNGITEKAYFYRQRKVWEAVRQLEETQEASRQADLPAIIPCAAPLVTAKPDAVQSPAIVLRNRDWTVEVNPGCDPELLRLALRSVK